MAKIDAILTGDLIGSRQHSSETVDQVMRALRHASDVFGKPRNFTPRFTRFRGDGWQVHLPWAGYSLEAILFLSGRLRAAGIGIETRIAAGVGTVENKGTNDLSDASGDAFTISGEALEKMGKRTRFAIAGDGIGIWQETVLYLVDHQSAGWTAAQAEVISMMLEEGSTIQEEVANRLGITRQAVQARLASAGYAAIEKANEAFLDYRFSPKTGGDM